MGRPPNQYSNPLFNTREMQSKGEPNNGRMMVEMKFAQTAAGSMGPSATRQFNTPPRGARLFSITWGERRVIIPRDSSKVRAGKLLREDG